MSLEILLLLVLLLVVPAGALVLRRGRRRPAAPSAPVPPARGGLVFQRPVPPVSRMAEMQQAGADKPPMFANSPAVLDGETAPERLPSS